MGTRSATVFIEDEFDKPTELCVLYRQFDGYLDGHGKELKEFLQGMQIVNGMRGDEGTKYANGCGCLAAQVISHFKQQSPHGGFYIYPPGNRQYYTYFLITKSRQPLLLRVEYGGKAIYDGPLDGFNPNMEIPEDD